MFPLIFNSSIDFRFASAVAQFGMLLRKSIYLNDATFNSTIALAKQGIGEDRHGYRAEFLRLIESAKLLSE